MFIDYNINPDVTISISNTSLLQFVINQCDKTCPIISTGISTDISTITKTNELVEYKLLKLLLSSRKLDINTVIANDSNILFSLYRNNTLIDNSLLSDLKFNVTNIINVRGKQLSVFHHVCMNKWIVHTIKITIVKFVQQCPFGVLNVIKDIMNDSNNKIGFNAELLLSQYIMDNSIIYSWMADVDEPISQMFTLAVLISDDYLKIKHNNVVDDMDVNNIIRWFNIIVKLPMELQTIHMSSYLRFTIK